MKKRKDDNFDGNSIRKMRLIKIIGILIVVFIVLVQLVRILIFDLTAVNILQVR